MDLSVTKKVRMSPSEARQLARLAKSRRQSEGSVLREALSALDRDARRRRAVDGLMEMARMETHPYRKTAFKLR